MSTCRVAILNADTPVPSVLAERGQYSDIFATLLKHAAAQAQDLASLALDFIAYNCVLGHYPTTLELDSIDAIIITGSCNKPHPPLSLNFKLTPTPAASVYETTPWILTLAQFLKEMYTTRPRIKMFGSCFGHQILCHALFSTPEQPVVSCNPAGWEIGIHAITLASAFLSRFGAVTSNVGAPTQLRQQLVHADHVVLHDGMPEGFVSVGRSAHCALQGVYQQGRVLTSQGHVEFDEFVNAETVLVFGKTVWSKEFMEVALKGTKGVDDAVWAAQVVVRFFLEEALEEGCSSSRSIQAKS